MIQFIMWIIINLILAIIILSRVIKICYSKANYWSCTNLADKIRGIVKPHALSPEEWKSWREDTKKKYPVRYYIAEELLDDLQDIVYFIPGVIEEISYYIRNRFISKSHCLNSSKKHIKRGQWCDLVERLLICNFDALVDFVEIEKANMQRTLVKDVKFKFKNGRSREAGFAYLDWEIGLKYRENEVGDRKDLIGNPTPQAECAKEIKELYLWWTETYSNREDLYKTKNKYGCYGELISTVDLVYSYEEIDKMEEQYDKEDDEMLIRLMKIRKGLWT